MSTRSPRILAVAAALVFAGLIGPNGPAATQIDWTPVGNAIGVQGKLQPDGVYRVGLPRTDLHVKLDGVSLKPSFALGSYLAFLSTGGSNAMMMGDLVLTEREIQPVMLKLEQGGIDVTVLHNHLIGEKPKVWYMHVMARARRSDRSRGKDRRRRLQVLDRHEVRGAGGWNDAACLDGCRDRARVPAARQGKGRDHGDFALSATQVNPVLRALRTRGIAVTALHSHMLDAQPTVFFLHFWAKGDAVQLARALRAGLAAMT